MVLYHVGSTIVRTPLGDEAGGGGAKPFFRTFMLGET